MSVYESEHGEIVLPAAAFSKVRKALELEEKRLKELGLEFAQLLWTEVPAKAKKDSKTYWDEIDRLSGTRWDSKNSVPPGLQSKHLSRFEVGAVVEHAHQVLRTAEYRKSAPARPQKQFAGLPTNRTTVFRFEEAEVVFNKDSNIVSWGVGRNNHAVEHAHDDPRYAVLSQTLKDVKWTRNTGGTIYYENEYQSGGESPARAYGPVGALAHPSSCIPYTMANGYRVTERGLREIADKQFRATRKAYQSSTPIAHGGRF